MPLILTRPRPTLTGRLLPLLCLALFIAISPLPTTAWAEDGDSAPTVPFMAELQDLPRDLAAMKAAKVPMLLFVHASYCPFCQVVDSDFISPMAKDPAYQGKLIVRRLEIDAPGSVIDPRGARESNRDLARRLGVQLVPVVVFFGPDGQAIGGPITGVTVPDFYPYYLQQGIDLAERCVKTPDPQQCTPTKKADRRVL